jgi:hypothetical protein
MFSSSKSSKSKVWQSNQQKGRYDETIKVLEILSQGGIHIHGAHGVEAEIKGDPSLPDALDYLENHAQTSWVKELRKDPSVTWRHVSEEHKKWNKKVQGLTPEAMAMISLVAGLATCGAGGLIGAAATAQVGAFLGSALAGEIVCTMANAAYATLISRASISTINNRGNIGKVLKEQGSKQDVRSLVVSVAAAGLTYGIADRLGISQLANAPLNDRLQNTAVQTAVSTGLAASTGEQSIKQALQQGIRSVVSSVVGAAAANQIKDLYTDGIFDVFTHKLAHAGAGALDGAIFNKDPLKGATAGAIGAVVAETVGDSLPQSMDLNTRRNMALLTAATTAFLLGEDVNTAILATTIALEHNFCLSSREEEEASRKMWEVLTEKVIIPAVTTECPLLVDMQQTNLKFSGNIFTQAGYRLQNSQNLSPMEMCGLLHQQALALELIGQAQYMSTTYFGAGLEAFALFPAGVMGKGLRSGAQLPQFVKQIRNFSKFGRQINPTSPVWRLTPVNIVETPRLLSAPKGIPNAGGYIRSFVTEKSEVYYRVYSTRPDGAFLTKVPPKSRALAREGLALPPSNEATYIQEVFVPAGTRLQRSRALPVPEFGKRGSMEQFYLIDEIAKTNFKEGKFFQ